MDLWVYKLNEKEKYTRLKKVKKHTDLYLYYYWKKDF